MTITIKTETIITCDNCGEESKIEYARHYAIKMARDNGWSIGKKVLCPDCQKELRGKK